MEVYLISTLKILLATIVGAVIGFEKEIQGKPAGIKTHALVCLGGCIVMLVGSLTFDLTSIGDPMRLPAQVVSGIGFLCAGVIITKNDKIQGLTTAAGLWFSGCMGICIGSKFWILAIPTLICYFFITIVIAKAEDAMWKKENRKK